MSDHDRGAYTPPTEEPLAFDARMTRQRRPLPMTLIASAVVLVVMVGAVVLFYRSGVRGANEPPRVVGESVAALKTPPVEEARPIDEAAGLEVYVDDNPAGSTAAPTFAPPPEQPRARPTAPVEVATLPPAAAAPAQTVTPPPAPVPAQAKAAPVAPAPAKAAPAPVAVAQAPAAPAAAGGAASVQIGAFSSTAIADAEFAKVRAAFAGYTAGRGKKIEAVERNGATLYRTLVTGFSKADAQKFCAALKASGRSCLVK